ncbi:hypothetical protein ACAW74_18070 [Fibrella sp. WM1]|uniref:hypothetical protein n=1 Tax=Fibrella musci TaxID=3242485 RepID=UPI003520C3E1
MKFLYYTAVFSLVMLVTGCKKQAVDPVSTGSGGNPVNTTTEPCKRDSFGWFRFSNNSNNPYDVYINNVFWGRVSAKTVTSQAKANVGPYKLYAKQVSGYVLYATERETTAAITSCSEYTWQFP